MNPPPFPDVLSRPSSMFPLLFSLAPNIIIFFRNYPLTLDQSSPCSDTPVYPLFPPPIHSLASPPIHSILVFSISFKPGLVCCILSHPFVLLNSIILVQEADFICTSSSHDQLRWEDPFSEVSLDE